MTLQEKIKQDLARAMKETLRKWRESCHRSESGADYRS